jgi:hypothetical protein
MNNIEKDHQPNQQRHGDPGLSLGSIIATPESVLAEP